MTHAWLIIAHNEFGILQRLISALDAPECDFFVHIDKKVKILPSLQVAKGRLFMLKERVDVRWGTISQIKTEILLLETALKMGSYSHYHIISGTHLPLKPVREILTFYDSHPAEEVMRFWKADAGDADFKLRRYHFPIRFFKDQNKYIRIISQLTWKVVLKIQKIFGIRHLRQDVFVKTDNWLSLTKSAAKYIVDRKKAIYKKYRWSFCGDEYFVASELKSAGEQFFVFDYQHLLYVDFLIDSPRTLFLDEIPELCKTDYIFARKFTERSLS